VLSAAGAVHLFDAMPSVGRKFLLAGKGGLNLTHAEPFEPLSRATASGAPPSSRCCATLGRHAARWAAGLGVDTFVGTRNGCFPPT
jgi:predicted flavoprotein YhiN